MTSWKVLVYDSADNYAYTLWSTVTKNKAVALARQMNAFFASMQFPVTAKAVDADADED